MKPQFKREEIYLDLSKLSEEQRKYVGEVTNTDKIQKFFKPFPYLFFDNRFSSWNQCTHHDSDLLNDKTELTYSQFLDMMEGKSEEVLQVENNEWIKSIAISHQKQMSSTHPHAIIGTIEDAIIEALETFKSNNQ